jgi:hypothetical protein
LTATERLIARIDEKIPVADDMDAPVLRYIRTQITPEGQENRPDEDKDVSHLTQRVTQRANDVLRRYEPKEDA